VLDVVVVVVLVASGGVLSFAAVGVVEAWLSFAAWMMSSESGLGS
jgi:hypothetical protein